MSRYPRGTVLNRYKVTYHPRGKKGPVKTKMVKAKYAVDAKVFVTKYNTVVTKVKLVEKKRT